MALSDLVHDARARHGPPSRVDSAWTCSRVSAFDQLDTPVWVASVDGRQILHVNAAAGRLGVAMDGTDDAFGAALQALARAAVGGAANRSLPMPSGDVKVRAQPWVGEPGGPALLCEALRPDLPHGVDALDHTAMMLTVYDTAGQVVYRNAAARDSQPAGRDGHRFVDPQDFQRMLGGLMLHGEVRLRAPVLTASGERWHEVSAQRYRHDPQSTALYVVTEMDVTAHRQTEERATYLAEHDALTGLASRNAITGACAETLRSLKRQNHQAAVLFIDLDHFKTVNDSLGHAAGDELLKRMADRLRQVVRSGDLIARLGGDEFLVVAALGPAADAELSALTDRLRAALSRPVQIGQHEVQVTPSMGVSLFPRDGDDIDTLMLHADMAMYEAKGSGRNGVHAFTPDLQLRAQRRLQLETDLRHAVERREFVAFFQPQIDALTQRVVGVEALARWQHPTRGLLPPGEFIATCEDMGVIDAVGAQIFEQSIRQQAQWKQRGLNLRVAINLSPRHFQNSSMLDRLNAMVVQHGADPGAIELEITESVLLGHEARTIETLEALAASGFRIAIDDFGTGYSNLSYLQRYPIQTLKIDRSFVNGIGSSSPLTELIITMCKALRLHMVAEGVEREEQLRWLRAHGVQEYQGYLFSPPAPADAI